MKFFDLLVFWMGLNALHQTLNARYAVMKRLMYDSKKLNADYIVHSAVSYSIPGCGMNVSVVPELDHRCWSTMLPSDD